jgi:hypothetical protein
VAFAKRASTHLLGASAARGPSLHLTLALPWRCAGVCNGASALRDRVAACCVTGWQPRVSTPCQARSLFSRRACTALVDMGQVWGAASYAASSKQPVLAQAIHGRMAGMTARHAQLCEEMSQHAVPPPPPRAGGER